MPRVMGNSLWAVHSEKIIILYISNIFNIEFIIVF